MIVKNESSCLAECLGSIRGIADEIVVCDTGSDDDTIEVALRFDAEVVRVAWHDDFAEARNSGLAHATGNWLLHMDADEVVGAESAARIRAVVDADGFGADAIEVTLANYCDDVRAWRWVPVESGDPAARGRAGYIPVGLLRLFRSGRGFEYREAVHESITESVRERGGTIRKEDIVIHHYGYDPPPDKAGPKLRLYRDIAQEKARQRPADPKAWHDLAELSLSCGDADAAEDACRKALELEPLHLAAATSLANILLNRGDLDDARALLERLEQAGVAPPHVLTALGAIACRQGRIAEARRRLEAALHKQPGSIQALHYLARVHDRMGETTAARRCLERAASVAPGLQEVADRLKAHTLRLEAESQCQDGAHETGLPTLVRALKLDPDDPITHNDLGVTLAALGQTGRALESFQRALRLAPGLREAEENVRLLN